MRTTTRKDFYSNADSNALGDLQLVPYSVSDESPWLVA